MHYILFNIDPRLIGPVVFHRRIMKENSLAKIRWTYQCVLLTLQNHIEHRQIYTLAFSISKVNTKPDSSCAYGICIEMGL